MALAKDQYSRYRGVTKSRRRSVMAHGGYSVSPGRGSSKRQEHRSDVAEVRSVRAHPPAPEASGKVAHGRLFTIKMREHLGLPECPYVYRWRFEIRPLGSLRIHHWVGPDDDRAFHDHPWRFVTLVVKGGYTDRNPDGEDHVRAPAVRLREAVHRHTVIPDPGGAWTVLITGPRIRTWGFWQDGKFRKARRWFESKGHHPCAEDVR